MTQDLLILYTHLIVVRCLENTGMQVPDALHNVVLFRKSNNDKKVLDIFMHAGMHRLGDGAANSPG